MKRTLPILLSIITLLSVFILPTSVSANDNYDEVDTKNAIAVNINETQYKESDLSFTKEEPMRTYKITAEEAGVYRFYASSSEIVGMNVYLFKPNNLNPTEYIKSSSLNNETRNGGFDITYYLEKNKTAYSLWSKSENAKIKCITFDKSRTPDNQMIVGIHLFWILVWFKKDNSKW